MDKIEKIKKWVQKQIELYWEKLPDADDEHPTEMQLRDLGQYMAYESMESFLDTLSKEPDIPEFPETFEICLYDGRTPDNEKCTECSTTCSVRKEEPDKSLEEAAEISFDEADALAEDYVNFLAKGLTENQPRPIGPHWFSEYAKKRFIVGAEWQKSQILKDAVEGYVNYYEDSGGILMAEAQVGCPYHNGDKVRIVVLKEEE